MCGLVGLCDGEMRGVVFAEGAGFEPREASAWLSPDVGGALPATAEEVLSVAQRQLRFVRSLYPGATGRRLTVLRAVLSRFDEKAAHYESRVATEAPRRTSDRERQVNDAAKRPPTRRDLSTAADSNSYHLLGSGKSEYVLT